MRATGGPRSANAAFRSGARLALGSIATRTRRARRAGFDRPRPRTAARRALRRAGSRAAGRPRPRASRPRAPRAQSSSARGASATPGSRRAAIAPRSRATRASGGARRRAGIAARGSPRPRRGGRAPRSASTPPSRAPEATTPGEPTAEGETHGRAPSRGAQDFEDDRARARVDDARGGSTRRPPLRGARRGGEKKATEANPTRRRRDPQGEGSREKKAAFDRVRTRSTVGEKNALERNSPDRRSFVLHVDSTERTLISVDERTRSLACSLCICMTNEQIFKAFDDELRTITCPDPFLSDASSRPFR